MSAHPNRDDLGAYVLGALDGGEAALVEEHLAGCAECRAEFDALSGLPALLATVAPEHVVGPPPTPGPELLDRVLRAAVAERVQFRRSRLARSAVAVLAAAGVAAGVTGVLVVRSHDSVVPPRPTTVVSAADKGTGVWAQLSVRGVAWGSAVHLRLTGVRPGDRCSLVGVGRGGERETAATWGVPRGGYGPKGLSIDGAVSLTGKQLAGWEVRSADGRALVWVDAAAPSPTVTG